MHQEPTYMFMGMSNLRVENRILFSDIVAGQKRQAKTSLIASRPPSRESAAVYMRQPNPRQVRADKAHSMSHALHPSSSTSRFSDTPKRDYEHSLTRAHPIYQKHSIDSGQASALLFSTVLPRNSKRNSLYERNQICAS